MLKMDFGLVFLSALIILSRVRSAFGTCRFGFPPNYNGLEEMATKCCRLRFTTGNGESWYGTYVMDTLAGLNLKQATMAQEGRSFCVVAEHVQNSQLKSLETIQNFQPLMESNFDIGNHIRPGRTSEMNIYTPLENPVRTGRDPYCAGNDDAYANRPAFKDDAPSPNCKNPYRIEVSEILAHKTRLHNYLHIKVFAESIKTNPGGAKNCPMGKIKYLMLEVRDALGFQVGHFTNEVPCDNSESTVPAGPNGITGKRHIGTRKNAIPCMYAHKRAVSHPGIFLLAAPGGSGAAPGGNGTGTGPAAAADGEYYTEVHATWRYAQHTSNFISQLHFAALIVEDIKPMRYLTSRRTVWKGPKYCSYALSRCCPCRFDRQQHCKCGYLAGCNEFTGTCYNCFPPTVVGPDNLNYACHVSDPTNTRPYGFIAQYKMLQPTKASVGGWDYYRKNFIFPEQVECHIPVSPKYYTMASEPPPLPTWMDLFTDNNYKADANGENYIKTPTNFLADQKAADAMITALTYVLEHAAKDPRKVEIKFATASELHKNKSYFGTKHTKDYFKSRDGEYFESMSEETRTWYRSLKPMEKMAQAERCPCPLLPTTLPPEFQTKVPVELEGRRLHAIQMFIAWVLLLPIAMFSARYFKETYSRVFFMQEFWWYTVHVLCLLTALLFMIGGIYVLKLNNVSKAPWTDEAYLHAIVGYLVMFVFTVHLFIGPFRLWNPYHRVTQIMMHWMFGVLEYLFGIMTILVAAALPQGFMNCSTLHIYFGFLAFQVVAYVLMELQMHYVDRRLALKPKRIYMPPPVMRLFHMDAPYSRHRMVALMLFVGICFIFYAALHLSIQGGDKGTEESCYQVEYKDPTVYSS